MRYTAQEIVEELEREVSMRKRVFPRWVAEGKLRADQAERRIGIMEQVLEDARKIAPADGSDNEQQGDLFGG